MRKSPVNLTSIDVSLPAPTESAVEHYTDTVFSFDSIDPVFWTLVPDIPRIVFVAQPWQFPCSFSGLPMRP